MVILNSYVNLPEGKKSAELAVFGFLCFLEITSWIEIYQSSHGPWAYGPACKGQRQNVFLWLFVEVSSTGA